jgi:hypothetical protein
LIGRIVDAIGDSPACEVAAMACRTFRDVLGEPSTWAHSATSTRHRPDPFIGLG